MIWIFRISMATATDITYSSIIFFKGDWISNNFKEDKPVQDIAGSRSLNEKVSFKIKPKRPFMDHECNRTYTTPLRSLSGRCRWPMEPRNHWIFPTVTIKLLCNKNLLNFCLRSENIGKMLYTKTPTFAPIFQCIRSSPSFYLIHDQIPIGPWISCPRCTDELALV